MAAIQLTGVSKVFPNGSVAVRDVSLEIADGELMVLVGPSGCGKSTLLRLIAGLESPSVGTIRIGGDDVTELPPQRRDLAMVFQSYALYPHLTVRENMAFGLRVRGVPAATVANRVAEAARSLGLDALLDRRPAALSGGQRQRVALGRAIVREPRAFLFDEPLSNLDPALRTGTRAELSLLHRRLGATMVYVTHDQEEAMTLGARIAVMRDGRIEQVGPPLEVFQRPVSPFVAQFIGSPGMNLFEGRLSDEDGAVVTRCGPLTVRVDGPTSSAGRAVVAGVRPHDFELVTESPDLAGRIAVVEPLGSSTLLHVQPDRQHDTLVRVVVAPDLTVSVDRPIGVCVRPGRLHLFDRQTGSRIEDDSSM